MSAATVGAKWLTQVAPTSAQWHARCRRVPDDQAGASGDCPKLQAESPRISGYINDRAAASIRLRFGHNCSCCTCSGRTRCTRAARGSLSATVEIKRVSTVPRSGSRVSRFILLRLLSTQQFARFCDQPCNVDFPCRPGLKKDRSFLTVSAFLSFLPLQILTSCRPQAGLGKFPKVEAFKRLGEA